MDYWSSSARREAHTSTPYRWHNKTSYTPADYNSYSAMPRRSGTGVMHQCKQFMGRDFCIGINADGLIIRGAQQKLFSEITKHICHQAGIAFGSVVGGTALGRQHDAVGNIDDDPLIFSGFEVLHIVDPVQHLRAHIRRPVDTLIGTQSGTSSLFPGRQTHP